MTYSFIAYIDEAGDDGIKKLKDSDGKGSTHWLMLGAVIVRATNDLDMVKIRDTIKQNIKSTNDKKDIHFRDFKHEQKVVACQHIAKQPLRAIVVASNKNTIITHPRKDLYQDKNALYWYLAKYLLERISHCCHALRPRVPEGNGKVKIIFSTRGGMNYQQFRDYLQKIKDKNTTNPERNHINWSVVDIELVENIDHNKRAGLQISDCVVSAVFSALEKARYGTYEPRYALTLQKIFYPDNDDKLNKGFTLVPSLNKQSDILDKEQLDFIEKMRAP